MITRKKNTNSMAIVSPIWTWAFPLFWLVFIAAVWFFAGKSLLVEQWAGLALQLRVRALKRSDGGIKLRSRSFIEADFADEGDFWDRIGVESLAS